MLRLCLLWRGSQNLVAIENGKPIYYTCPHCEGLGCTKRKDKE